MRIKSKQFLIISGLVLIGFITGVVLTANMNWTSIHFASENAASQNVDDERNMQSRSGLRETSNAFTAVSTVLASFAIPFVILICVLVSVLVLCCQGVGHATGQQRGDCAAQPPMNALARPPKLRPAPRSCVRHFPSPSGLHRRGKPRLPGTRHDPESGDSANHPASSCPRTPISWDLCETCRISAEPARGTRRPGRFRSLPRRAWCR